MQSKKILWISVVVAVIIVAVLAVMVLEPKRSKNNQELYREEARRDSKVEIISRSDIKENIIPDRIPTDLPLESNVKVIQNYNEQTSKGFQSTRMYESGKSLETNFEVFSKYFKNQSWNVTNTMNEENLKMLFGKKGDLTLQVTITRNTVTNQNIVDVTVTFK